jgi:hypothetical protein
VVILRIYSSASFKRIAHLTSQSEDAASSVFYRAIGKLRNDPVLLDLATEKVPANVSSSDREDKKV